MMPKPVGFSCVAAYFCSFIIDCAIFKSFHKRLIKCPIIRDVDISEKPDFKTKRISWGRIYLNGYEMPSSTKRSYYLREPAYGWNWWRIISNGESMESEYVKEKVKIKMWPTEVIMPVYCKSVLLGQVLGSFW